MKSPERFEVTDPRATSRDPVEPKWESGNTVTVGPSKGDMVGSDQKAIQAAVDYVARLGGGTVRILPGTCRMRNAVYLRSHVWIVGTGLDSVLLQEPSLKTKLAADSDWYEQEVTLADPKGFEVGDGIYLQAPNANRGSSMDRHLRTLVVRSGQPVHSITVADPANPLRPPHGSANARSAESVDTATYCRPPTL
jgi:hypothetical protein